MEIDLQNQIKTAKEVEERKLDLSGYNNLAISTIPHSINHYDKTSQNGNVSVGFGILFPLSIIVLMIIEFSIEWVTRDPSYYQTSPWPIILGCNICGYISSISPFNNKFFGYFISVLGLCIGLPRCFSAETINDFRITFSLARYFLGF